MVGVATVKDRKELCFKWLQLLSVTTAHPEPTVTIIMDCIFSYLLVGISDNLAQVLWLTYK